MSGRTLVVGLARTGEAAALVLHGEGEVVTVVEEHPGGEEYLARRDRLTGLGIEVLEAPAAGAWSALVGAVDRVVPSPGVPWRHVALTTARDAGVPVVSEIELAAQRIAAPIVAVTGTNGKTTVTELTAAMLRASGVRALAAGNIGRPLIDVPSEPAPGPEVVVAEVSSFQLAFTQRFRPRVAVLLPIAEDHVDWHGTFESYAQAKARIFANQRDDDLLVYDADDPVASRLAVAAPARRVAFTRSDGARGAGAAYRVERGRLVDPDGAEICRVGELTRSLPHDIANALAASAAALAVGATRDGVRDALRAFRTLPHRVALVGEAGGVRWYDDSKATNPHATLSALASFDSAVLLAGGRNKGLDLSVLAEGADHVRAVVAFGEAADEVQAAFASCRPVVKAIGMREAVRAAGELAQPGDAVLLSPGCASFDAYPGYAARGDDFAAEVRALTGAAPKGES